MYVLVIVIGVLSQGASIVPVGVTSQIVGKFKNLGAVTGAMSNKNFRIFIRRARGFPPTLVTRKVPSIA